ncbi:MAG: hypothetical protein ACI4KF_08705 [Huintestinicola sp.]
MKKITYKAISLSAALLLCGCGAPAATEIELTALPSETLITYLESASDAAVITSEPPMHIETAPAISVNTIAPPTPPADNTGSSSAAEETEADSITDALDMHTDEAKDQCITSSDHFSSDLIFIPKNSRTYTGYALANDFLEMDPELSDDNNLVFRMKEAGIENIAITDSINGTTSFTKYSVVIYDDLTGEIIDVSYDPEYPTLYD